MVEIKLNHNKDGDNYHSIEAYKLLRTNIEFSGEDNKVILFTSCTPNEGKTMVSFYLSSSLAEAGKKVLYIDADLRKSIIIGRMRITKEIKGLSHFLSGQSELGEVLCKTNEAGLTMIFAGPVPPNPTELLGSRKFEILLKEARKKYDYVIVDTPPLGSVVDSAVISKECDAAVLVIAANAVSYKFARTVKEQLERVDCKILGAVLNKVNIKKNKYYGKYYAQYGKYGTR